MNTKNILVAALLVSAAGFSAISANASADADVAAVKTTAAAVAVPGKTRAQVKAELAQAYAAGWRAPTNAELSAIPPSAPSTKTRAEVKAELRQAYAEGWRPASEGDLSLLSGNSASNPQEHAQQVRQN